MATFEATPTLPVKTVVTGETPDRDPLGNLVIKIDVGTGTFHCRAEEHAGKHKSRFVTFHADAPCMLYFSNFEVFQLKAKQLVKGENKLRILDTTNGVETDYCLDEAGTTKVAPTVFSPPRIVVP